MKWEYIDNTLFLYYSRGLIIFVGYGVAKYFFYKNNSTRKLSAGEKFIQYVRGIAFIFVFSLFWELCGGNGKGNEFAAMFLALLIPTLLKVADGFAPVLTRNKSPFENLMPAFNVLAEIKTLAGEDKQLLLKVAELEGCLYKEAQRQDIEKRVDEN